MRKSLPNGLSPKIRRLIIHFSKICIDGKSLLLRDFLKFVTSYYNEYKQEKVFIRTTKKTK